MERRDVWGIVERGENETDLIGKKEGDEFIAK
jgi:hypothetical protein